MGELTAPRPGLEYADETIKLESEESRFAGPCGASQGESESTERYGKNGKPVGLSNGRGAPDDLTRGEKWLRNMNEDRGRDLACCLGQPHPLTQHRIMSKKGKAPRLRGEKDIGEILSQLQESKRMGEPLRRKKM